VAASLQALLECIVRDPRTSIVELALMSEADPRLQLIERDATGGTG
jgi:hypothetical protein